MPSEAFLQLDHTPPTHSQHERQLSFSRQPQRYHRRSISLRKQESSSSPEVSVEDDSSEKSDFTDHAVEADDEKGPLVRLLPAPPLRSRKGLRGHDSPIDSTPFISPLPTPAVEKQPPIWAGTDYKTKAQKQIQQKDDQRELYEKYQRRRRTEIARRSAEIALLALIGLNTCRHDVRMGKLQRWKPEFVSFLCTVGSLYAIYPFRTVWSCVRRGASYSTAFRKGFHIPSRFDPGALIYPIFLPCFIAVSLGSDNGTLLITNMILGLCSLPVSTVPLATYSTISYLHWVLSVAPIYLPETLVHQFGDKLPLSVRVSADAPLTAEELSLLFPLHQMTLRTLVSLTTTSLDPSEAQLLSTGLLNLLFFAKSPQAKILKALIWIGGLGIFVLCGKVLSLEVALARIPAWKFARNRPTRTGVMGRVNKFLSLLIPESSSRFASSSVISDSDSDEAMTFSLKRSKTKPEFQSHKKKRSNSDNQTPPILHGNGNLGNGQGFHDLARSATFSTFGRAATIAVRWRRRIANSSPLLLLTFAQAEACKWLFAVYTYLTVALVILVPVRYYIGNRALSSLEPVGWAVGYFIGDVPRVRMFVVNNNLERWIAIPMHKSRALITDLGWVEIDRQSVLGAANTRLGLAAYCVFVVACGIGIVQKLNSVVEVDTRRKVFHGVMVAMLLPTIPVDPCFFALALTIVLAVFLMLDLFRASQLPPISKPLTTFLAPYVDGRDHRGPVVVSHIFLLIGCAIPLWLSLAGTDRTGIYPWNGWDVPTRDLGMISGVVCVGMGDAAASLIGRRFGKTKWYWSGGKSIEGSLAFAIAVTIGLTASYVWLIVGGWRNTAVYELPTAILKASVAGCGASLLESTLTAANDNVVVPVGLWLLVRGLKI